MCLIIDETKHKKFFGFYLPKIAKEDIPVYKVLDHYDNLIYTPIQCYPIKFHKNKAILRSILIPYKEEVSKGIHAYRDKINIRMLNYKTHKAIIPKFSLYYIGVNNNIVSTKLIIFEN